MQQWQGGRCSLSVLADDLLLSHASMATLQRELTPSPVRSRKLIRRIALGVTLLIVTLTVLWFRVRPRDVASADKPEGHPTVHSVVHLESFVVNLADPDGTCFLRVGIDLGLERELRNRDKEEADLPTAQIRDTIILVLTGWNSDALLAAEGKEKLKAALLSALRTRVPELGVQDVYFTDFLVQR